MKKSYLTATDQFCGAGGSSIGLTTAGVELRLGLNHWKLAIETHASNFPDADHDCTDVSACDPRRYPSTDLLITSPECTNHSLAKGKQRKFQQQLSLFGKVTIDPAEERSRATMWDVPRFAEYHKYNLIIVENVVDARYWATWDAWLHAMDLLGYDHHIVYHNSMFSWPTPQSRDRLYVVFWRKGNRAPDLDIRPLAHCAQCSKNVNAVQVWKKPHHRWGRYRKQYLYRCPTCESVVEPYYYCAANAIDWSLSAQRIGDRGKPLKEKTLARIRVGLEKFAGKTFLFDTVHTARQDRHQDMVWPMSAPGRTQIGQPVHGLVMPFLTSYYGTGGASGIDDAVPTVTSHDRHGVCVPPFLVSYYTRLSGRGAAISGVDEPVPTQPTWPVHYLAQPGETPAVEDCGFRMLQPHEIHRAMAFPEGYVVLGNARDKVKQLGNAVNPPVMEDLTRRCVATLN